MNKRVMVLSALILAISGCSLTPDYERPQMDLPSALPMDAEQQTQSLQESNWWSAFGDEELPHLVEEALQHNADIGRAVANLQQVEALLRVQKAQRWPELSLHGGTTRRETSYEAFPQAFGGTLYDQYDLGVRLSYELDFFGRLGALSEAAMARYHAGVADEAFIRLSVASNVAQAWLNLRALDQMVLISERTVKSRQETVALRQQQYELGSVTQLTLRQAQAELAGTEAELAGLVQQRNAQRHALGVLLGRSPAQLVAMSQQAGGSGGFDELHLPAVPAALPSDLLQRRPDILAAEQRLIAANADIGAARAALFPSVMLSGSYGQASMEASKLLDSRARTWEAGVGIDLPLLDFGKRKAVVKANRAAMQGAVIDYQQAVRTAFAETLDAISDWHNQQQQLEAQQRQVVALRETEQLAQKRFDGGYTSYLEVLDAQRNLFRAELALEQSRLNMFKASVRLYKALGGQWGPQATA